MHVTPLHTSAANLQSALCVGHGKLDMAATQRHRHIDIYSDEISSILTLQLIHVRWADDDDLKNHIT